MKKLLARIYNSVLTPSDHGARIDAMLIAREFNTRDAAFVAGVLIGRDLVEYENDAREAAKFAVARLARQDARRRSLRARSLRVEVDLRGCNVPRPKRTTRPPVIQARWAFPRAA